MARARAAAMRVWAAYAGVSAAVGVLAGCGSGGGTPKPLPNVLYLCHGSVFETGMPTVSVELPGTSNGAAPEIDICDPPDVAFTQGQDDCQAQCTMHLKQYVDVVNAANNTTLMDDQLLSCSINDFEQKANSCTTATAAIVIDQPGGTSLPTAGGPAQYVANLSGNMHVAVNVDVVLGSITATSDTPISGQMGYTIIPLDRNCPEDGCQLLVTTFGFAAADFNLTGSIAGVNVINHQVTGMSMAGANWITGVWQPSGHFQLPAGAATLAVTATDNGQLTGFTETNGSPITGTLDPVAGQVSFDSFSQVQADTTTTIGGLSGINVVTPPVAVITLPATVECNKPGGATVTLDSTASAPVGAIPFSAWRVNGGPTLPGAKVTTSLNLGPNDVLLNIYNAQLAIGVAEQTTTVVDTTPPVIAPPPTVTAETCSDALTTVTLTAPKVTDVCNPSPTVTGSVISSSPPIPIVGGQVSLPPGTHTVRWTASDGIQTATATQTVVVQPGILVKGQFLLDDRAKLQTVSGGAAGLGNAGTVTTKIGNDTSLGDILSVAPVVLSDRATVQGSIRSNGTITLGNSDSVSGSVVQLSSVSLPPVPDLTGVTFPSPSGGARPSIRPTRRAERSRWRLDRTEQ